MPKDKIIHFPRQKLENMSDSEFDAILKRLINHIVDDSKIYKSVSLCF